MLKKLLNVLTKQNVNNISLAFDNIRTNLKRYPAYVNKNQEIYSQKILREEKLKEIHNQIIYPEAVSFNELKHEFCPAFKNGHQLQLEKAFLEWSISEDGFSGLTDMVYYCDKKLIQVVICNHEISYEYWHFNGYQDVLKPDQILLFDNETPLRFFNHNKSDLAFFLYTNELKEEVVENYYESQYI